jgi:hydroxymethylglutaryl-CoA synthase
MDWVRAFPDRKAIVIASDVAKYELESSGEYTQGAGAVAILIANNPAILELNQTIGVGMEHVGDFFKPRKTITNKDLKNTSVQEITKSSKEKIELYVEEPVFDGYYSNTCYQNRISEALEHFNKQKETDFLNDWDHLIFHLPYAFQGRRMMLDIWLDWINGKVLMENLEKEIGKLVDSVDVKVWKKAASKSSFYQNFVRQKIEAGEKASMQIGNMYTASVFMSFLSFLTVAKDNQKELVNNVVGFLSYGSGSKSKILEGKVVDTWRKKINHLNIFESLDNRNFIDFKTYEKLHNKSLDKVIIKKNSMVLKEISNQENMQGFRYYS